MDAESLPTDGSSHKKFVKRRWWKFHAIFAFPDVLIAASFLDRASGLFGLPDIGARDQPPDASGKPIADIYLDDRAIRADRSWKRLVDEAGEPLGIKSLWTPDSGVPMSPHEDTWRKTLYEGPRQKTSWWAAGEHLPKPNPWIAGAIEDFIK